MFKDIFIEGILKVLDIYNWVPSLVRMQCKCILTGESDTPPTYVFLTHNKIQTVFISRTYPLINSSLFFHISSVKLYVCVIWISWNNFNPLFFQVCFSCLWMKCWYGNCLKFSALDETGKQVKTEPEYYQFLGNFSLHLSVSSRAKTKCRPCLPPLEIPTSVIYNKLQ